ncbi:helix-turn-helix domain-containing protein [Nocardia sp. BSTN01]|uniref:winged helix-turn-helix transcriptional regulator n=1 Tax=Nocardia sp. BSTN01 TaxID=2783665 RepID=UPI00281548CC|nr:helix-turn-helix domain-containing protein [Nocardia sp. BSTN01]
MPVGYDLEEDCPFQEVLERVASKWVVQVILASSAGPVRFTELESAIDGISRRMLTLTLRRLERDGLVTRTVYPCVPPRVEYTATEPALELQEAFQALADWALRHRPTIAAARRVYDNRVSAEAEDSILS